MGVFSAIVPVHFAGHIRLDFRRDESVHVDAAVGRVPLEVSMPTAVSRVRPSPRRSQSRIPRAHRPARAGAVVPAEPTFGEIAAQYLERHIERYLVPRAAQLARYAHAYLATVNVAGPDGASMRFTEKPFRQITTMVSKRRLNGRRSPP
jgi:hypothetical protein